MTGDDFVFCNDDGRKIAASSAAMTDMTYAAMTDMTYAAMSRTLRVLVGILGMLNWKNVQDPKCTGGGVFGSARD